MKPPRKTPLSSFTNDYQPPKNPFIEQKKQAREQAKKARSRAKRNPPEKQKARNAVRAAIAKGELVPKQCELCFDGCQKWPTEAHHESYEPGQELNVKWACKSCHDKLSSAAWRESYRRKQRLGWPSTVCHVMGPQCAGKSFALRRAGVGKELCWDVLSFYERVGAVEPGESFPPKLRLLQPQEWYRRTAGLKRDLFDWLQRGPRVLFVESSGLNRRLNGFLLDAMAQGRFKIVPIYLDATPQELVTRASLRKLDLESVLSFQRRWRTKIGKVETMCHSQAVEAIQNVLNRATFA